MSINKITIQLHRGDCLEKMADMPDNSVELILTDPPYGTTKCDWDSVIDLDAMWREVWRVAKPGAAVVMFASQPFTTNLIYSQIEFFKYSWVWKKHRGSGFAHAKNKPLKLHEDICVFSHGVTNHESISKNRMVYNPQELQKMKNPRKTKQTNNSNVCFSNRPSHKHITQKIGNYPTSVLEYKKDEPNKTSHPTQKPVALLEYLIKTYSNEGDTVLDFTMGSGSTGVACIRTNRNFIGIELDSKYFKIAKKRINGTTSPLF